MEKYRSRKGVTQIIEVCDLCGQLPTPPARLFGGKLPWGNHRHVAACLPCATAAGMELTTQQIFDAQGKPGATFVPNGAAS